MLILLFLIGVYNFLSIAQSSNLPDLIPYRKGNKWGYCDREKKIVIECKYDFAEPFYKNSNYAIVEVNGKKGLIDKEGKEILTPQYYNIEFRSERLIEFSTIDNSSKRKYVFFYNNQATEAKYDYVYPASGIYNGIVLTMENSKYGIFSENGEIVPTRYNKINYFEEDLALVEENGKFGYIDRNGKVVIPLKYDDAKNFKHGFAAVKLNNKWGFISKDGKEITPFQYELTFEFNNNIAPVLTRIESWVSRWGFINNKGDYLITPKYSVIERNENFYNVKYNDKWGVVDNMGKEIIPPKYDEIYSFSDDVVVVLDGDKEIVFNKDGEILFESNEYQISMFENGTAGFRKKNNNNYWGLINKKGEVLLPPEYELISSVSDGRRIVSKNKKYGVIDTLGNFIVPLKYNSISYFRDGYALVSSGNGVGIIDINGKEVVPCKYDRISDFYEDYALFVKNGKMGFVDKNGIEKIPAKYRYLPETRIVFENGLVLVSLSDKNFFYIDKNGTEYWEK